MHTLYDVEAEVSPFVHITPANIHDTKAMSVIPYERGAHYIFDRGYNDFWQLVCDRPHGVLSSLYEPK